MRLFKKKDEERKAAYKPTSDAAKESAGAGGKGGGEPAKPSYDVGSKKFKQVIADARKEGGVNNDGRFGYGYIDENTGVEVPWYIDMINGGGANAAGQEFVSPFGQQGSIPLPMGMVGRAATAGLNAAGIAPYGYNQPRRYAQAGMQGYPTAAPAPTGGGASASKDTPEPAPAPSYRYMSNELGRGVKVPFTPDPYGVGSGGEMTMPNYTPSVSVPRIEMNTMSDLGSGTAPQSPRTIGNFPEGSDKTVSGSSLVPPAIFSANAPSVGGTYTPPPSTAGLGLGKGMFITDYVASKGLPVTSENIMALMDEYMALGYGAN